MKAGMTLGWDATKTRGAARLLLLL